MSRNKSDPNEYDNDDERFVRDINNIEDAIGDQRVAGGKRVDEYVRAKGGIQYGEQTIESIAQHPDMQVCAETLRRWWAYFRLYGQLGKEISAVYPKARARDYYELARIMGAKVPTNDGESQDDAERRIILELVDWLAKKRKNGQLSCNDFAAMVTERIGAGSVQSASKAETAMDEKKPDNERAAIGNLVAFDNLQDTNSDLEIICAPEHPAAANINIDEFELDANRLLDRLDQITHHHVSSGNLDPARKLIVAVRHRLDEIESLLAPTEVPGKVE